MRELTTMRAEIFFAGAARAATVAINNSIADIA